MTQTGGTAKADGFARVFLAIGVMSFGGPAGQIATLHRELVERRGWIDAAEFERALGFAMLLPGPEAQQLATWCGWRLRERHGGVVAGLLFIVPGALVMAALAGLYLGFGRLGVVQAVFAGVQAAVVAVVVAALWRVSRRALSGPRAAALALAALVLLVAGAAFPLVMIGAAVAGAAVFRGDPAPRGAVPAVIGWGATLRIALFWGALWLAPLVLLALALGRDHGLVDLGGFFAGLAATSFGGAYAGLAFVAQGAAAQHGWVTAAEVADGLALAESTPGPLVLVYQFIGALAGTRIVGGWGGAAIGMALVLWVTFVPSFLLVLALAPQLDRLLARPGLAAALRGVTAAVVGAMASLALWLALHVLFGGVVVQAFGPVRLWAPAGGLDTQAATIALLALALLGRLGLPAVLALAAAAGLVMHWLNPG